MRQYWFALWALSSFPSATLADGIADDHIGDVGIETHPSVIFAEDFEDGVEAAKLSFGNAGGDIVASSDTSSDSSGSTAVELLGPDSGSNLYRRLSQSYDLLHFRYYVKYGGTQYHHTGGYVGGYDPPTDWPQGDAGLKGVRENGDRLLHIGFETQGFEEPYRLDFYANWIDMQGLDYMGLYYGRNFVEDLALAVEPGTWHCVELMVKLNTAADNSDGELALWMDDELKVHFKPGEPSGAWTEFGGWDMDASGTFGGFRWRDSLGLGVNWVKIQNYDATPSAWFDDVVAATERIGCIAGTSSDPNDPDPMDPGDPTEPSDTDGGGCRTSTHGSSASFLVLVVACFLRRRTGS